MISNGLENHPYLKISLEDEKVKMVVERSKINRDSELRSKIMIQFIDERGKKSPEYNWEVIIFANEPAASTESESTLGLSNIKAGE